jgi:hypothetical protein
MASRQPGYPERAASAVSGGWPVERYLAEVTTRLPGSAKSHSGIVAELRSGLLDATDSYRSAGLPPAQAIEAAIAEFGDPAQLADGFRPEVVASHARRVLLILLVTGPLVGLLWVATAAASHLAIRIAPFWRSTALPAGLGAGLQLVAVAAAITALAAVLGVAASGRLSRFLPAGPRRVPLAAAIAGFGAVGADGLGLLLLAAVLAVAPGRLAPLPAAAAAVASLARLLLARRAACRCLELRASLG